MMSQNGKLLTKIMNNLDKPGKVRVPRNQWQTPGEITRIPSRNITMKGVGFDAIGVSPDGTTQYMHDGHDYYFPSAPVTEYPMMQVGGIFKTAMGPLTGMQKAASYLSNKLFGSSKTAEPIPDDDPMFYKESNDPYERFLDLYDQHTDQFNQKRWRNDAITWDDKKTVNLSKGRFQGANVPQGLIDAAVIAAKKQNVDPWRMLSVLGRESTFGTGTAQNKERRGSKKDLVSGWDVAEEFTPYSYDRYLADKKVPGVQTSKDNQGWHYRITDLDKVRDYLQKHPELVADYEKKLKSTPDIGDMDSFQLAARYIKQKGIKRYNPNDPKYEMMVNQDMQLLKADPRMREYMKLQGYKNGGQHGGLDRWFAEKWVDVKTGKECGRDEGEKRRGYPACRPSRRVNDDTPKTASELSSSEREKFVRSKTSSERINYQHRRKEYGGEQTEQDMANKPNNPSLWSKAKSLAKEKFDVYPSAYANGWAAKWYKSKGGTWSKAEYGMEVMKQGGTNNPGFEALPEYVQAKILSNMGYGGMAYPFMQDGGEPDGAMALGQIDAAMDKLMTLRKFIQPNSDLEPWVSSKLTLMDHYTDAVSDYMQYNPEAQGGMEDPQGLPMPEMKNGGGIPERYKNMGFNKVGVKKESTRPGKKWMVLAKKGDQYKVVHGGYDGMKDYTQHGSEKRRDRFWDRMGGKNSSKATDPFSPLYWHKRFGTWEDGGEIPEMKGGGSTWSGNTWYQYGGDLMYAQEGVIAPPRQDDYPNYESYAQAMDAYIQRQGELAAGVDAERAATEKMWQDAEQYAQPIKMPAIKAGPKPMSYQGSSIVDMLSSVGKASDYNSRKQLAAQLGITNYYGSADQNMQLMKKIQSNPSVLDDFKMSGKPGGAKKEKAIYTQGSYLPEIVISNRKLMYPANTSVPTGLVQKKSAPSQAPARPAPSRSYPHLQPGAVLNPFQLMGQDATGSVFPAFFQQGGMYRDTNSPVAGQEMEVTPEQLEMLRAQGYQFEII